MDFSEISSPDDNYQSLDKQSEINPAPFPLPVP